MIDRRQIGRTWPPFETEVEKGRLRLFAKAIGETGAIHVDEAAARAAGYRSLVAPPTFVACLTADTPVPLSYVQEVGIPVERMLHAEVTIRHFRPVCAGDRLRLSRRLSDIYEKKGGALEFIVFDIDVHDATSGELVAELRSVFVDRDARRES
jgi:acyl dehydratase